MTSRLIIIRGNSGSGKSTVARLLREKLGERTMLVQQDIVRLGIVGVKDREGNPAIELITRIASYGSEIGYDVVLEGILSKKLYGTKLHELVGKFDEAFVFYMDVSFEETLKRHVTKPNKDEYGEEKMREWWIEKDYLGTPDEYLIPESYSVEESIDFIIKQLS